MLFLFYQIHYPTT